MPINEYILFAFWYSNYILDMVLTAILASMEKLGLHLSGVCYSLWVIGLNTEQRCSVPFKASTRSFSRLLPT